MMKTLWPALAVVFLMNLSGKSDKTAHPPDAVSCGKAPAGMACIPGGFFIRGHDSGPANARPSEKVWLQTFYMDLNEVTYAEYSECEKQGKCPEAEPQYIDFNHPLQPMNGVSWYDAAAYCKAMGKHLPTEAEWEKAARGTDGRVFPWGNSAATCEKAVIRDSSGRSCGVNKRGSHPEKGKVWKVGSKPAAVHGLYDMAGNSFEWVFDWYSESYAECGDKCTGVDPRGPCDGADECPGHRRRVVRGGSWYWPAHMATTFYRRAHVPGNKPFHHFGFRCAASVKEAEKLSGK